MGADHAVAAFWGDEFPNVADGVLDQDLRDPRLGGARNRLPRPAATAIGSGRLGEYEGLRIAAGAPKGGLDFAYARRLSARCQF